MITEELMNLEEVVNLPRQKIFLFGEIQYKQKLPYVREGNAECIQQKIGLP